MMTYTIINAATQLKPSVAGRRANTFTPVPMRGTKSFNYSFVKTIPAGAIAAIKVSGRSVENVRRSVQMAGGPQRHTTALDNILLVW